MNQIKISPSLLSSDFSRLGEEVLRVERAGAEYIHIDVMDGIFVPNITLGAPVIKSLRGLSGLVFDVHLMITKPERYIKDFAEAGADIITIHLESTDAVSGTLRIIKELGKKAAVTIKPATPVSEVMPYLSEVDMVLIMTVEPGFGGQSFMPDMLDKVKAIRAVNKEIDIEVDGGVSASNIAKVKQAGANVIVAGSALFSAGDMEAAITELRSL